MYVMFTVFYIFLYICLLCIFRFPFPFSLYSLSDVPGWMLWPDTPLHTSGYEVLGREVSVRIPPLFANCVDNWGSFLSFQLWLTWEPLSPHTGWNVPSWTDSLFTVCLLFASFCRELGRRHHRCRLSPSKLILWLGKEYEPLGLLECVGSSLPRARCHQGQRGVLKGNKDTTLLTPELQSTRQVVLSNLNLQPTAVISLHSGTLWQAASKE